VILPILLAHVPLAAKLIYDYRLFLRRKPVNHKVEWIILAILETPVAYLFASSSSVGFSFMLLLSIFISGLMIAFYTWLMFDGIYNLLRGEDWWFIGSPDTDPGWQSKDSWAEKFLRRIGVAGQITIKIGGFILFTVIYILL
jgi:hypothetical protein